MHIQDEGILLTSTHHRFESEAVFNPTCILEEGTLHMFYRATRPGNFSSIGYCKLQNNQVIYRSSEPVIQPEFDYERQGTEDPRLVKIGDTYHLFYIAYDGLNARLAYATATQLPHFTKHGLVSPSLSYQEINQLCKVNKEGSPYHYFCSYPPSLTKPKAYLWDKDAFLFPQKIKGRFALIHRLMPEIQILYFDQLSQLKDLQFWQDYLAKLEQYILLKPRFWFEKSYIGGGAPPILTEEGWLLIYHAVEHQDGRAIYRAGLALLDKDEPQKVLARLPEPFFEPANRYEKIGIVPNVIFPTAAVVQNERLCIYYGAADHCVGLKSVNLKELLAFLKKFPASD